MGGALGTFYSEWSVAATGCGPPDLADSLERGCYLVVLMITGLSVFWRNRFSQSVASSLEAQGLRPSTIMQMPAAEWLAGVAAAALALALQLGNGAGI